MTRATRAVIAGMPRSGTTLLATILSSGTRSVFLTDYLHSFVGAARRLGVRLDEPLERTDRLVALAVVRDEMLRIGHPVLVRPSEFSTIDELHAAVMQELISDEHVLVGHKMRVQPEELEQLLGQTALRVIVMMRDPRDAALSYWHRVGAGVEDYVESWRGTCCVLRRHSTSSTLITIRFEDLVSRPEATLQRLSDRLGIDIAVPDEGLRFRRGPGEGTPWRDNSAFRDIKGRFDTRAIGRWRRHQGSPVVRFAAWRCSEQIQLMDYPPTPEGMLDLGTRVRFTAHRLVRGGHERLSEASARLRDRLAPPLRHR